MRRLRTVNGPLSGSATATQILQYRYDALGRVVASVAPGGAVTEMDYDANGNAAEMRAIAPAPGESLAAACAASESPRCVRERMLYDAGERAIAMTDPLGNETRAAYDTRGRLVRTLSPLGAETRFAAGRRITKTPGTDTAAQTRYEYDGLGLTEVEQPGTRTHLSYDPLGRRTARSRSVSGAGAIHTDAVYPSEWVEFRGGQLVRLVRGGGPDGVLAEIDATAPETTTAALLDDGLGNLAHADPLGASYASPGTRRYEAFGTVRSETGATTTVERGFAGLVPEGDTGLLYARARHYEPETGRFLQPEPMGLFQPNLYSYASNNPIVFSDPSGLAPQLNLSGPPDFLEFGSGDPFFSPTAIASSLEQSGGLRPLTGFDGQTGLSVVEFAILQMRPNETASAGIGDFEQRDRLLLAQAKNRGDAVGELLEGPRNLLEGRNIARTRRENAFTIRELSLEASRSGTVRGEPINGRDVFAFEFLIFREVGSTRQSALDGNGVFLEFADPGTPVSRFPTNPGILPSGDGVRVDFFGPFPVFCSSCEEAAERLRRLQERMRGSSQ